MRRALLATAGLAALVAVTGTPARTEAFCGFYVGGAGAELFNNATMVVLMRDGTRTVLSMQNNYQGPPKAFAMVVPVPVVLAEENVKTLPRDVFDRVDQLAAPRLVEYWEQDPCPLPDEDDDDKYAERRRYDMAAEAAPSGAGHGVKIEAQFSVGEYDIVVLSAEDSQGLDTWLRQEGYNIPAQAEPLLRPYVAAGMKFFVAKVDVEKVTMKDGQAMLSPLRFHYDSEQFALPVRLGMANSAGTQDLIVHILAKRKRYELANYKNVFIPTNLPVAEEARDQFGAFYAALFDATLAKNPGAVVTEYSWMAGTCDPCPGPVLSGGDLATLGADVLPSSANEDYSYGSDFVLTRLHARYGKDTLKDDLVFKEAAPVAGGRGVPDAKGKMITGVQPLAENDQNQFQGRYVILHPWTGSVFCSNPNRGNWGGPPGSSRHGRGRGRGGSDGNPQAARDLASAPRGTVSLPTMVREDVPEIGLVAQKSTKKAGGCGCAVAARSGAPYVAPGAALVALALLLLRRRGRAR